ncbi:MAG: M16 family metallopeptidase, partial [Spirochaetota bacterium]
PGWENMTVSFQSLDENAPLAFETVADLLAEPAFTQSSFDLSRSLLREKIAREGEDPFAAAYARARELIFDKKGYGVRATLESADSLSLETVSSLWSEAVKSGNLVIAVSSSRPLAEVKAMIEKNFAALPSGARIDYPAVYPSVQKMKSFENKIYFIQRDIPQATVIFCAPAPGISDEGAYALRLADEILGGGAFNSKLTREIREKRGLAYSAGSIMRMRRSAGIFVAYSHCDADKTGQTLSLAAECIADTASGKFSAEDLSLAKQSIVRSYIFQFDSPMNILSHYLSLWYNGFDESYLKNYPVMIESQKAEDLRARFSALSGQGMARIVIGNRAARASLAGSGEIVDVPDIK